MDEQFWDAMGKYLMSEREITDRWLRDFSAAWNAAATGDRDRPPKSLHDETMALQRQQEKGASSITVAGLVLQMDENGAITLIGSGSHYILVSAIYAQEFRDAVNQLIPASDPAVVDINTQSVLGGAGQMSRRIPTNQEMSRTQNELALKALREKRR